LFNDPFLDFLKRKALSQRNQIAKTAKIRPSLQRKVWTTSKYWKPKLTLRQLNLSESVGRQLKTELFMVGLTTANLFM
jgi:hypothetical protein